MEGTYYLQIGTILHDRYEIKEDLELHIRRGITRFRQRYV